MAAGQIRLVHNADGCSLTFSGQTTSFSFSYLFSDSPLPIWGQTGACWDNSAAVKLSQTSAPVGSERLDLLCGCGGRRKTGSLVMKACPPRQQISPHTRDIFVLYRKGGIFRFPSSKIFPEIYFVVFPKRSWNITFI